MNDLKNEKRPSEPQNDDKNNNLKTPKFSLFLVIISIVVLPVIIMYFNDDKREKLKSSQKWNQSEFVKKLDAGEVTKVTLTKENNVSKKLLNGEYKMPNGEIGDFSTEVEMTDWLNKLITEKSQLNVKTEEFILRDILISILPIIFVLFIIMFIFSRQVKGAGKNAMLFGKSRARLDSGAKKFTFSDVAGLDESKEEVEEVVRYLRDPGKVRDLGGKVPKGILLVGPPGTGKTLLARAIAGEANAPFYSISGSDFVEMFVGVGASRVRDMFDEAKKSAPCLIFIDEIDAVGRARFAGIGGGNDEREQTLNALLVEMDGFEVNSGIVVIAATNRPDVLDTALLRPGRFDRRIYIDLPDRKGREEILAVHAKKVKLAIDVDLSVVARNTPGFSGADLANLLNESALTAARTDKKAIEMVDIEEAKEKVLWGRERKSRKIKETDRKITAYHEAGHALVGLKLEHAMPLHKITIIPRGNAYLGATMYLPEDDSYHTTIAELKAQLAVSMGGRVAEKIIFNDFTTGASADIMNVTKIAKKMVCQWGMSETMGPLDYAPNRETIYSANDMTKGGQHSNETSNKIDIEVRRLVDEAVDVATKILTENRENLDKFAQALLEKETMCVKEVCELLNINPKDEDEERFTKL